MYVYIRKKSNDDHLFMRSAVVSLPFCGLPLCVTRNMIWQYNLRSRSIPVWLIELISYYFGAEGGGDDTGFWENLLAYAVLDGHYTINNRLYTDGARPTHRIYYRRDSIQNSNPRIGRKKKTI